MAAVSGILVARPNGRDSSLSSLVSVCSNEVATTSLIGWKNMVGFPLLGYDSGSAVRPLLGSELSVLAKADYLIAQSLTDRRGDCHYHEDREDQAAR
jgi:hypothetical protein